MKENKNFILGIFIFILGSIITLIGILLPKSLVFVLFIIFICIAWYIYDRYIVTMMGWDYKWWSPHIKKLIIGNSFVKIFDPKTLVIDYFLWKEYDHCSYNKNKQGFEIWGAKKGAGIMAKFSKREFVVKFMPLFSKKAVEEMKEFEKYLDNLPD